MKVKVIVSLVGLAFFFGVVAQAQERQIIDVSVTYSYVCALRMPETGT